MGNNNSMKGSANKRRQFIKQSSIGAMGLCVSPSLFAKVPASDKLRVAHIGVNGMGNNHMQWFTSLPEVEVVALCDVDARHLSASLDRMRKELQPGIKIDGYEDFRHILDRKDIDAITCATPDHWHAQIAALAFQAGKDVYGEKPLSYTVEEGQMMLREQQKHQRIFQLGTQIHATDNYHRVAEIIQSGALGKIHTIRLWKDSLPPVLGNSGVQEPPAEFNYDFWLGPAPYSPYIKERTHLNYRYFMEYSGGIFADFWCHIADIAWWAAKPTGLKRISARGQEAEGFANTPGIIDVDYEFDNLNLYWTTKPPEVPGASERNIGAYFEGEKGTLVCDYQTREITINGERMQDLPSLDQTIPRSPGHPQDFVNAVKSRSQPSSNLAYAREMTLPMHLGLISWQLGRDLQWNAKKEKFRADREANALLAREARSPWNLIT